MYVAVNRPNEKRAICQRSQLTNLGNSRPLNQSAHGTDCDFKPCRAEDAKDAEALLKLQRLCGLCELCAKSTADWRERRGPLPNPSTDGNKRERLSPNTATLRTPIRLRLRVLVVADVRDKK